MNRGRAKKVVKLVLITTAVLVLLPLLFVEGIYRYGLHLIGDLPVMPEARVPERLQRAMWAGVEGGTFTVVPRYPWHTVLWLIQAKFGDSRAALHDFAPGERACNRAAQLWLAQQQEHSLRRIAARWALVKWCTRNWTAAEVAQVLAEKEYFGRGLHGIADAAQGYFGKAPDQLAAHELALLAGLPLNPDCHPERALKRRGYLLGRFREAGLVTADEYQQAMLQPLGHRAARCADGDEASSSRPFAGEPAVWDVSWGMTLDQVRTLHPGGIERMAEPETEYRLVVPALGYPKAVVRYYFERGAGLRMVSFSFPAKDGRVDPATGDVSPMKKAEARAMRADLRDRLATILGEPTLEVEGSDMGIQWKLPGEMVGLLLPRRPQAPDEAGVGVTYFKE